MASMIAPRKSRASELSTWDSERIDLGALKSSHIQVCIQCIVHLNDPQHTSRCMLLV